MKMNKKIRTGLFILALTLAGLFLLSSQARADISVKTPDLQMDLEKLEIDPVSLDTN